MSRAETRRRRILRDDGTGLVQKTCTNRFWAARAVSYPARAAIPSSIARQPIPPSPGEDCFPESAPGTARGVRVDANTHLDLGRLEGRDGAGEGGGNAGHFCCWFLCCKEGEVCGNGASAPRNARFIGQQTARRVGEGHSANRRAEKNRNRRIYWRPGFYVAGSRKVSPRLVWSVSHENRILGNPTRIAHQGRSLRRPILVGTQRESRYGRSLAGPDRFPGDATEGISTIEIESPSRAHPKRRFLYGNQSPRCRDFEWTTWHTNRPARLMIADEKIFSCTKAEILPRRLHSPAHVL